MAVTQLQIRDGSAVLRNMQVTSTNGAVTGNLSPLQTLVGVDGANPATSANPLPVASQNYQGTPLGFQAIASLVSAQSLTIPSGATSALVQAEGGDVRWLYATPTGSSGMRLYYGTSQLFVGNLASLQFINVTGQTATLNVVYYQ